MAEAGAPACLPKIFQAEIRAWRVLHMLELLNSRLPPTGHVVAPNTLLDIMQILNNIAAPVVLRLLILPNKPARVHLQSQNKSMRGEQSRWELGSWSTLSLMYNLVIYFLFCNNLECQGCSCRLTRNEFTKILKGGLHKTISGLTITYGLSAQQLRHSLTTSKVNFLFQRKVNEVLAAG